MKVNNKLNSKKIKKLPSILLGVFVLLIVIVSLIISANKMMEYIAIKQQTEVLEDIYVNKLIEIDELKYYINTEIDDAYKERMARLLALATEICSKKNSEYKNKTIKVLVEGVSKTDENKLTGRSESNRLVHFEGDQSLIGTLVSVKLTKAEAHALFGELKK